MDNPEHASKRLSGFRRPTPVLSSLALLSVVWLAGCQSEPTSPGSTSQSHPTPASVVAPGTVFLHGTGATANPATLFLDAVAPTATAAKYKDSPSIKFSGGNPWTAVGTWTAAPAEVNGSLAALGPADVWLGLKNSDDIGTRFDVRVEAYKNGTLVASGESRCIQGITRNANLAKEVEVPFDPFTPADFNGTSDVFSLKVLTRIGTTGTDTFCGGHSNAVGLRLYFDGTSRAANVPLTISPAGGGDSWTTQSSMPTARWGLGAAAMNGILYAVGGLSSSALATLQAYDPTSDTWTTKASMPSARYVLGAVAINGTLFAVGGQDNSNTKLATVEAYDPTSNTWTTRASMPTARSGLGVATINGTLYAVGGADATGNWVATVEAYDPGSNTWTTKASLPTARHSLAVAASNGILYAVGGVGSPGNDLVTVEAYDPGSDTWSTKAPMPTGRQLPGAAALNGTLYVVGGLNASSGFAGLATIEAYDPTSDTWTTKAPLPTARFGLGVATITGALYAVGGFNNGARTTLEAYHP